jgi:hypothetical protein
LRNRARRLNHGKPDWTAEREWTFSLALNGSTRARLQAWDTAAKGRFMQPVRSVNGPEHGCFISSAQNRQAGGGRKGFFLGHAFAEG